MEKERVNIQLIKPTYSIGQKIYVPSKDKAEEADITAYEALVMKEKGGLVGIVLNYSIRPFVSIRRGLKSKFTDLVKVSDFYIERAKAEAASKFMEVSADPETWKLAIGDRDEIEEDLDIYEARDILIFCQNEGGLIVHERDKLANLLNKHKFDYDTESPIGKILVQLGIQQ